MPLFWSEKMTIPASMPARVAYIGDGVTVDFPIPFMYFENTDGTKQIKVVLADEDGENETVLIENTDFTVTDGENSNGTLTLLTAPETGKKLTVIYNIPIEQLTDYAEFGRLPSESIERALDKQTAISKQMQEQIDRCVKVEISGNQTPAELLAEVYNKLDSATDIAAQAISAASEATTAADNATAAVESAERTLADVTSYVDTAKIDINETKNEAIETIANTVETASQTINQYIADAEEEVRQIARDEAALAISSATEQATTAATENVNNYVDGTIKPVLNTYVENSSINANAAQQYANAALETLHDVEETANGFEEIYNNRVNDFNANAAAKTNSFNENAAAKQGLIDASAIAAENAAAAAKESENNSALSEANAAQSALLAQTLAQRVRSEGIPMSVIEQKRIEIDGSTVKLYWQDPRDTIIDGYVLSSWKSTTIVKKQGSYPEDIDDGTVVAIITTRNKYLESPLTDTQENAENWYYRAFPLSVNGVYCLDKRNCFGVVLFGYRINETDPVPETRVEYLQYCDNYFYDPCIMDFVSDTFNWGSWRKAFFIPKPCALSYNGTVDYYLNPDNFTLKADGSASDIADSAYEGNFMCEFPAIFVKVFKENNYINVLFSNIKLDDDFECWSCKKSDESYASNFYLPMFEGTNINSKLRSIATTGKPTASTNAETEATLAMANGSGWNTTLWADEVLMMLLFPLLFKSTDSQSVLGYGGSGSTSALTVNNNAAVTKGLMYGTSGGSAYGINYLGMHNWYGHRWRRPNGLMNASGNIKIKMTHSTVDGSSVEGFNRTGDGYISTGVRPPEASQSYINRYEPLGGGKYGIVPKATSGSSSTFYCDGMWTNNGQLDQLILGGSVNFGLLCGAFCFGVTDLPARTAWDVGASLSYHNL